jgi:hypothetical protein
MANVAMVLRLIVVFRLSAGREAESDIDIDSAGAWLKTRLRRAMHMRDRIRIEECEKPQARRLSRHFFL